MKTIIINQHGNPEVLEYTEQLEIPKINDNEVLVKLAYTSINRIDTVIRKGYPGLTIEMPHILGGDIAGTIEKIGNNVNGFNIGEQVVVYPIVLPEILNPKYKTMEHLNDGWKYFGMHIKGSYAEYIAVPVQSLIKIPAGFSLASASAIPIAGLTAYHALKNVGNLQEGDYVLIWGAAGGFGTLAIQIAKLLGANVIATTSKEWKKKILKEIGADYVFDTNNENIADEIRDITKIGVDVVMDYVGPHTFPKSFASVRKGGKILLCGMLTGMEINLHIQQTYFRHISIHGLYLGTQQEFKELIALYFNGNIKPYIHKVFQFNEVVQAHQLFESGEFVGKILLKP